MSRRSVERLAIELLGKTLEQLNVQEKNVLLRIRGKKVNDNNPAEISKDQMSFGDRLSDRVAAVGGSWGFIIAFGIVLFGWMFLNSGGLGKLGFTFDPYPFIFLNLILSTLAAVQAPIIMMSQNRQSSIDRLAAQHDYEVNLRSQLDIIRLHEKMDELMDDIQQIKQGNKDN